MRRSISPSAPSRVTDLKSSEFQSSDVHMATQQSKFSDLSPRTPIETSRLLAPTKASLAKTKALSKVQEQDDNREKVVAKKVERTATSPVRSSRVSASESSPESSQSEEDHRAGRKSVTQSAEKKKIASPSAVHGEQSQSSWNTGNKSQSTASGLLAAKKYSESVRLAHAKNKSPSEQQKSPKTPEKTGAHESIGDVHLVQEVLFSASNEDKKLIDAVQTATSVSSSQLKGTRVPIWPDLSPKPINKIVEKKMKPLEQVQKITQKPTTTASQQQSGSEGFSSPISPLDFRLPEDAVSPTSSASPATRSVTEHPESDSDADSEKKLAVKRVIVEPLEFATLDFVSSTDELQDLEYARKVLVSSGFADGKMPEWFSATLPLDPALFQQLELELADSIDAANVNARRQRMLLFDAINEALCRLLTPFLELPVWMNPAKKCMQPMPAGKQLLKEIWTFLQEWPVFNSDDVYDILDDAARRDMSVGYEKWNEFAVEESQVLFELESMFMQDYLEELIQSFLSIELKRRKRSQSNARVTVV